MAKTEFTAEDIAQALTIFIKSGSANGYEPMRRHCLKIVNVLAAGPDLLAALQNLLAHAEKDRMTDRNSGVLIEARAAIKKATS